jgi:NlpC/P60 family
MKHLFFVAVAGGILSGTSISVKAQTLAKVERIADRVQPKISLKFIEGIEFVPAAVTNTIVVTEEKTGSNQRANTRLSISSQSISRPGFVGTIEFCSPLQFKYAMMIDKEVESIVNNSLYNFIDKWWATRYQYGGTDRTGIDCSAFTSKLLSEVYSVTIPRIAKDQYKICEKLAIENLVEGDLVFFNTRGGISHVGLYLGNNYFVHSSVHEGVAISSLTEEYYKRRFISGGRISQALKGS